MQCGKADVLSERVQYGRQQYSELRAILLKNLADLAKNRPSPGTFLEIVEAEEKRVEKISPESIELWHGIVEGAGLPYVAVLLHLLSATLASMMKHSHNSYSRWRSEIQYMKERCGGISLKDIREMLALHDRYDGESWHREEWDMTYSFWTPEKHGPFNKTYMQTLAVPEGKAFYICQGQSDAMSTLILKATGNMIRFSLEDTPDHTAQQMEKEILMQVWQYVRLHHRAGGKGEPLDEAKKYLWYGD
ncbi:MAG: hypothetical protein HFE83_03160 [Lachnospiraceae bacterium]|nr:hypothetical protein [Lachnospiraceae bacterium]